ncbi:hypothetical protein Taro_000595 [Colocasia esculenta]|uniref:Uncharacterized protein n=1 Tax=Colocasia esculenta TaxID=4460 RepID=A0A843TCF8_COLES|nr:hypothetical protein [Colocasia esculenta]
MVAAILLQPWLPVDDVEVRQLATTSRGVMIRQSNRPQHHEALCFPHRRQWTMEYSCKVWCRLCRRKPTPRQHSRPSWRPRLRPQLRTMVDLPSWSDSREWPHSLLRGRVIRYWQKAG